MGSGSQGSQSCYLALDQGGHSSRALIFDAAGQLLAESKVRVRTRRPAPGRVEQNPDAIVASLEKVVCESVASLPKAQRGRIRAAGLATQRSSIVCWDRITGKPLTPVLSWQDLRGKDWLRARDWDAAAVHRSTGLFVSPHYGASKFRWCLDHVDGVKKAHRRGRLAMGPLASFLLFRLAAERPFLVDPVNASRTLLWNLEGGRWDEGLMDAFGIPAEVLPGVVPNRHEFGSLNVGEARIPLRVVIGDQNAAVFGSGDPDLDTVYVNVGTGAFALRPTGSAPRFTQGLLTGVLAQLQEPIYALEGTVNGAVSAIDWAKETLGVRSPGRSLARWLAEVKNPPLFRNGVGGLGSPYWQPDFESSFQGEGTVEGKFVAVVESVVFLLQINLEAMQACVPAPRGLRLSGGFAILDGFCQRLADLSGLRVHRPALREATARGVARLAAQGSAWGEQSVGQTFTPRNDSVLRDRYAAWCALMDESVGSG